MTTRQDFNLKNRYNLNTMKAKKAVTKVKFSGHNSKLKWAQTSGTNNNFFLGGLVE